MGSQIAAQRSMHSLNRRRHAFQGCRAIVVVIACWSASAQTMPVPLGRQAMTNANGAPGLAIYMRSRPDGLLASAWTTRILSTRTFTPDGLAYYRKRTIRSEEHTSELQSRFD